MYLYFCVVDGEVSLSMKSLMLVPLGADKCKMSSSVLITSVYLSADAKLHAVWGKQGPLCTAVNANEYP